LRVWLNRFLPPPGCIPSQVGTLTYAAPETLVGGNYEAPVDMWATGCVLYTLLCGCGRASARPAADQGGCCVSGVHAQRFCGSRIQPFEDSRSMQELFSRIRAVDVRMDRPELSGVSKQAKKLMAGLLQAR